MIKRSARRAFHHASAKHLDRYLKELEWRFLNRKNQYLFMDTRRWIVRTEPIKYAQLIGNTD